MTKEELAKKCYDMFANIAPANPAWGELPNRTREAWKEATQLAYDHGWEDCILEEKVNENN